MVILPEVSTRSWRTRCSGRWSEAAVGSVVVVGADEGVDLGLEFGAAVGSGLGSEPFLHCLLEAFDFAAGGGVYRAVKYMPLSESTDAG